MIIMNNTPYFDEYERRRRERTSPNVATNPCLDLRASLESQIRSDVMAEYMDLFYQQCFYGPPRPSDYMPPTPRRRIEQRFTVNSEVHQASYRTNVEDTRDIVIRDLSRRIEDNIYRILSENPEVIATTRNNYRDSVEYSVDIRITI